MDDPRRRVTALPGEGQSATGLPVEDGAHGDELVHTGRALVDEDAHGVGVAQAGSRGQRVGQMEVGRVLVAPEDGGDATLGPSGGGLGELGLGEHPDPETGPR